MGNTLRRIRTHRKAKQTINSLYDNDSHCLVIHYSCESFYDIKDGKTPRITSIAVRYLNTAQTKSFSIHKVAELKQIPIDQINGNYDQLEKEMLEEFFKFVEEHKDYKWIHWNMRNINYGFEALKYRAKILGAKIFDIKDENKFDLAKLLIDKYGKDYSSHPRLPSILEMNKISSKHWLNGDEEATAFDNKEYVKLHQSTLAKVDVIENILKLTAEESLKTESKLKDIYGISPQGLFELAKDNWLYSVILIILSALLGAYFGKLI
jgi:DNA polymerase elongation subunit (family B)